MNATAPRRFGRLAAFGGCVLLAAGVALPTNSAPAIAASSPAAEALAASKASTQERNGYLGVQVEVKNRTKSKVIYVKDRHTEDVTMIPSGSSSTWTASHSHAGDEVELAAYYDHRTDGTGIELDGANGKAWWPTFSVAGDVENFSTDEMKVFNPGDGGRYVVTRISDSDDHKRFVVEVTPPGPITKDQAERGDKPGIFKTRGTHVTFANSGDQPIWIREYNPGPPGVWGRAHKVDPGGIKGLDGDYPVLDDVEARVYFSESDAQAEENHVEVDAENPAYSTPWMSVDWDSEYFSVGGTHTWITEEGHRFEGQRMEDSKDNKEFRLDVTAR